MTSVPSSLGIIRYLYDLRVERPEEPVSDDTWISGLNISHSSICGICTSPILPERVFAFNVTLSVTASPDGTERGLALALRVTFPTAPVKPAGVDGRGLTVMVKVLEMEFLGMLWTPPPKKSELKKSSKKGSALRRLLRLSSSY